MVFRRINQPIVKGDSKLVALDSLLKSVARTFYLSLSYLPEAVHQPMSLAYLLARLSDTVVDDQSIPISLRRDMLLSLKRCVQQPQNEVFLAHMHQQTQLCLPYFSGADLDLLESCEFLFSLLQRYASPVQTLVQQVLLLIFEGQTMDLEYFDHQLGIVHFKTDRELDRYLYLVAGSVGEFWTKLCFTCIPNYATESLERLLPKAIAFGKALQLTNILRDINHDLQQGRCYLPFQEGVFSGENGAQENSADRIKKILAQSPNSIQDWRAKALLYLQDAKDYTDAINHRRIRFSTLVPMHLAHKTLAALPVKISKKAVYLTLMQAWFQAYLPISRSVRL